MAEEGTLIYRICRNKQWELDEFDGTALLGYTPCFEEGLYGVTVLVSLILCFIRLYQIVSYKFALDRNEVGRVYSSSGNIVRLLLSIVAFLVPVGSLQVTLTSGGAPFEVISQIATIVLWLFVILLLIAEFWYFPYYGQWIYRFVAVFVFVGLSIKLRSILLFSSHSGREYVEVIFAIQYAAVGCLSLVAIFYHPDPKSTKVEGALVPEEVAEEVAEDERAWPGETNNWVSRMFYWWIMPVLRRGYNHPLQIDDLPHMPDCHESSTNAREFLEAYAAEKEAKPPGQRSLTRVLYNAYGRRFMLAGLFRLLNDCFQFIPPIFLTLLIAFAEDPKAPDSTGYMYALIIFAASMATTVAENAFFYQVMRVGLMIRSGLTNGIYIKSLRLTNEARADFSSGAIVNYMASDLRKLENVTQSFHSLWSAPLRIIVAVVLLVRLLGASAFAGLGLLILLIPLQARIVKYYATQTKAKLGHTDTRIKVMNEVLAGMRVIKYYVWENSFLDKILGVRKLEIERLAKAIYSMAVNTLIIFVNPVLVELVSFMIFAQVNREEMGPSIIFTSMSLFSILRFPLIQLPSVISAIVEARVSMRRLSAYFEAPETDHHNPPANGLHPGEIVIRHGDFTWDAESTFLLEDINLQCRAGDLVAIVGSTGSGKSSMISAILREMRKLNGSVASQGSIAYVAQEAWIYNATVRNNIVFGLEFDQARYDLVVKAACLEADFTQFAAGDATEIGEKGINLSGGQKQRISIARALYADADIYLFDDPLSALDAHVGSDVFHHAIRSLLRHKTRILVTNQLQFVHFADAIVVMDRGKIAEAGTYRDLISDGRAFADLMEEYGGAGGSLSDVSLNPDYELNTGVIIRRSDSEGSGASDRAVFAANADLNGSKGKSKVRVRRRSSKSKASSKKSAKGGSDDSDASSGYKSGGGSNSSASSSAAAKPSKSKKKDKSKSKSKSKDKSKKKSGKKTVVDDLASVSTVESSSNSESEQNETESSSGYKGSNVSSSSHSSSAVKTAKSSASSSASPIKSDSSYAGGSNSSSSSSGGKKKSKSKSKDKKKDKKKGKKKSSKKDGSDSSSPGAEVDYDPSDPSESTATRMEKVAIAAEKAPADGDDDGKLITEEERAKGSVSLAVYGSYLKAIDSVGMIIALVLTALVQEGLRLTNMFVVGAWSVSKPADFNFYMTIYGILAVSVVVISLAFSLMMATSGLRAGKKLHEGILRSIMRAPMSFFDTTPLGRVINRFSNDQSVIDQGLMQPTEVFIRGTLMLIGTMAMIGVTAKYTTIGFTPAFACFYFVQRYFRRTARELKRLDSITKSPILANFSETLSGVATIRAYAAQSRMTAVNDGHLDSNILINLVVIVVNRWLSMLLGVIGNIMVLSASVFAILDRERLGPANVGLIVSISFGITGLLNMVVRLFTEVENSFNAVERVLHYTTEIGSEAPEVIETNRPPTNWPSQGAIEFRDVEMRYREGIPLVLKGMSCSVGAAEKIGIVGRTGAGKSSLFQTIYRIAEYEGGSIRIDGIEIQSIGLSDLRTKLSIIPQEPMLFTGSLRFNLDPFAQHTDEELWDALTRAHLKDVIARLSGKLETEVAENGENFSVGQRQLICLARALLRDTKILILDEATAAVDVHTDHLIQETIRENFGHCTTLTIAHRLNTIIDSDKVLVLGMGKVLEFDSPAALLRDRKSEFSSMVDETGADNAAFLRALAFGEVSESDIIPVEEAREAAVATSGLFRGPMQQEVERAANVLMAAIRRRNGQQWQRELDTVGVSPQVWQASLNNIVAQLMQAALNPTVGEEDEDEAGLIQARV